jgi:STIP1 family protein 1
MINLELQKNKSIMASSSNKYKEEGNKLFMKRNYKEAIEMYTKAIEKSNMSIYNTNRALCYFKLQQWHMAIEDCRRAIELDPHSVKAHFYMGQAHCELNQFDEACVHLKRAHDLTKELNENYGDEITRTIRNVKRRRWNFHEEKRVKQEIELQTYLNRLMLDDREKQIAHVKAKSSLNDDAFHQDDAKMENLNEKDLEKVNNIETDYQQKFEELTRLFNENDSRRIKREIPDYLCGKISFELMEDPVITPSGITYDRYDIEQHLHRVGRFDPVTRQELTIDQLIPNLTMKEVLENFVSQNEWIDGAL